MDAGKPSLRDCDECEFFWLSRAEGSTGPARVDPCQRGHRPRFYNPRGPMDQNWGYKRRCADFAPKEGENAANHLS